MPLDGYGNADGMLRRRVTKEQIGDVNCTNMKPLLSPPGKQHHVKWNVPSEAHCLEAWGRSSFPAAPTWDFHHKQVRCPPSAPNCANTCFQGRTCVKQFEIWKDDNRGNGDVGGAWPWSCGISATTSSPRGWGQRSSFTTTFRTTNNRPG
ncbi:hypothetical protein [Nonomuraea rubra]|uniref:Uncharacterized protein n=1 Tax=Nonomuraea rubra TaxID=46180 RepID=A0A7X0U0U6_9ACTN|nr:hypothetical protein [Nonomuraea rubra]MBB6551072.1 hypothetical protein [Nonomuraea rubra]